MIILRNIKVPYDKDEKFLRGKIESELNKRDFNYKIYKKSLDARREINFVYQVVVDLDLADIDKKIVKRLKNNIEEFHEDKLEVENINKIKSAVIVGTGPAGLFAAYLLAKKGVKVTLIERGKEVDERVKDIDTLHETGKLDENSNVQFGEGGAGTFSDGKLTSRSKDKRVSHIFEIFVKNGAPEDILYEQKAHIGTDILRNVIKNMRRDIEGEGAIYKFSEKLIDFDICNGKINKIITDKGEYSADCYILAIGNSARDTFIMLDKYNLIEQKPFAVGFRIEHLRKNIEKAQYGMISEKLPAATYQLNITDKGEAHSVYTFCMCPGGYVVNSSSIKSQLCVNGMSYHDRAGENSNSAIVATIDEKIYGKGNLAGMNFQNEIEKKAYKMGDGLAPVQRVKDFMENRVTEKLGEVLPTFKPGYVFADLNEIYPESINHAIKNALKLMDRRVHGFCSDDAILTGVETRTSSPIRIVRENYRSEKLENLFPIGEGAGYSGGIISSALDGLKCAIEILEGEKRC
ncbi:NAD(P)/FAD-dependent oxidoreductase [Peptoniphilus sp.]|uniref:NAD(P)/FAD-dependent oxidoreductase n=1 Tax=Peptoniphilus sp. TaxID=1971214 RepID=UPI002A838C98|nr:NAD(P)-binding protein [Peptoniphilus sp.]MDY3902005.1 NAD(P)-binding protein [Peptoniphilus sp.]